MESSLNVCSLAAGSAVSLHRTQPDWLETQHSPFSECGLNPVVEWNHGCDVGEDRLTD